MSALGHSKRYRQRWVRGVAYALPGVLAAACHLLLWVLDTPLVRSDHLLIGALAAVAAWAMYELSNVREILLETGRIAEQALLGAQAEQVELERLKRSAREVRERQVALEGLIQEWCDRATDHLGNCDPDDEDDVRLGQIMAGAVAGCARQLRGVLAPRATASGSAA